LTATATARPDRQTERGLNSTVHTTTDTDTTKTKTDDATQAKANADKRRRRIIIIIIYQYPTDDREEGTADRDTIGIA
jgi:hypothetical protein